MLKKETIIADTDCGGLKMIHFESMQKAIKLNGFTKCQVIVLS